MTFIPAQAFHDGNLDFDVESDDCEMVAVAMLGEDDVTGAIYKALVSASTRPGHPGHREIHFLVIETLESEPENLCNSGLQTKRFLRKEHRAFALHCISSMICAIMESLDENVFVMSTVETDLPKKALKKYELVCEAARACGFDARRTDPYHGNHQWIICKTHDER